MPRIDWVWLLIGIALGYIVIPKLHGIVPGLGGKKAA
jgi:hypothetical protein